MCLQCTDRLNDVVKTTKVQVVGQQFSNMECDSIAMQAHSTKVCRVFLDAFPQVHSGFHGSTVPLLVGRVTTTLQVPCSLRFPLDRNSGHLI